MNYKTLRYFFILLAVWGLISCASPERNKHQPEVSFKKVANSKPQVIKTHSKKLYNPAKNLSTSMYRSPRLRQLFKMYGSQAKKRIQDWNYTITDYRRRSEMEKLYVANHFINRLKFVDDKVHWQQRDYWATPLETLASSGGDCEDFAIAKYYTLTKMGVPDQCLTLNYVMVKNYKKPHMVLVYQCFNQEEALVLDNLNPKLLSVGQRKDLVSVYSFNQSGMWYTNRLGEKRRLKRISRLKLWDDVRLRIKQESL